MPTNVSTSFTADVEAYIANETLPLARRRLVAYRFGDPLKLPKGRGVQYQAARWNRLPLPFGPLSEGTPPVGQSMSVTMVSATAVQWGDKVTITDIAEMTIKHPMFEIAKELCTLAVSETLERNTYNALLAGTQVNYVNNRGARASLIAGDVLNIHEFNRMDGALETLGAPRFMGDEQTNKWEEAESGGARASSDPRGMPHYAAIIHTLCVQDVRENATFVLASSYSDINKLYNAEIGELSGIRFCASNMVPFWTGYAQITGTPSNSGGTLTNAASPYYVVVTGQDTQNQYESYVSQVSAGITIAAGSTGSISFTTPNVPGYTFTAYIGTTTTPTNIALCASGPTSGPYAGLATQLPANTSVVLTGIGPAASSTAFTAPAAPQTGITVYPTFIFGRGAYGQVVLDEIKYTYLDKADKSDPHNQLRVVGWKVMYGTILLNSLFFGRIESTSAFAATFG
jgi:N4-gp56 family major capsid protein